MGMTMEELAQIRSLCADKDKIGFCLDTCHLFASGVWRGEQEAEWLSKAESLDIMQHVAAIHLNDSVYGCGEKRDRHAVLGEGTIGEQGLQWLLSHPWLRDVPFILETPSGPDGAHMDQLALARRWGKNDD